MRSDARKKLAPTEQPYDTSGDGGDKWEILRGLAEFYASLKSALSVAKLGQGALDLLDEVDSLAGLLDASIDAEERLEADLARKDEQLERASGELEVSQANCERLRAEVVRKDEALQRAEVALVEAQRERDEARKDRDGWLEAAERAASSRDEAERQVREIREGIEALADEYDQSGSPRLIDISVIVTDLRAMSGVPGPTTEGASE